MSLCAPITPRTTLGLEICLLGERLNKCDMYIYIYNMLYILLCGTDGYCDRCCILHKPVQCEWNIAKWFDVD